MTMGIPCVLCANASSIVFATYILSSLNSPLVITMFSLLGNGLNFFGSDSYVFLPIMTVFSVVISLNLFMSSETGAQGIVYVYVPSSFLVFCPMMLLSDIATIIVKSL